MRDTFVAKILKDEVSVNSKTTLEIDIGSIWIWFNRKLDKLSIGKCHK
jgi:hypothetical protein